MGKGDSDKKRKKKNGKRPEGGGGGRSGNALKHGLLTKRAMLPWERYRDYEELLRALMEGHAPVGPTEAHLVEEIAGIIWRKRRLVPAERHVFAEAMWAEPPKSLANLQVEAPALNAAKAVETLKELTDIMDDNPTTSRDALRMRAAANVEVARLEHIARYETHLDRKMQRILGMLLGLQRARQSSAQLSGPVAA